MFRPPGILTGQNINNGRVRHGKLEAEGEVIVHHQFQGFAAGRQIIVNHRGQLFVEQHIIVPKLDIFCGEGRPIRPFHAFDQFDS